MKSQVMRTDIAWRAFKLHLQRVSTRQNTTWQKWRRYVLQEPALDAGYQGRQRGKHPESGRRARHDRWRKRFNTGTWARARAKTLCGAELLDDATCVGVYEYGDDEADGHEGQEDGVCGVESRPCSASQRHSDTRAKVPVHLQTAQWQPAFRSPWRPKDAWRKMHVGRRFARFVAGQGRVHLNVKNSARGAVDSSGTLEPKATRPLRGVRGGGRGGGGAGLATCAQTRQGAA